MIRLFGSTALERRPRSTLRLLSSPLAESTVRRRNGGGPRRPEPPFSPGLLSIDPRVRQALDERSPVVALESTIISHGMPYPENLRMARGVERLIRAKGAVPATVAVMDGRAHIGLSPEQLETLARAGPRARKCSRRDLAVAIAQGVDGATTVASTAYLASLAGVRVFVTGGVGGVHRGAEATFDISADLVELGWTPMVVVCSGVKSILDIEKTLEVLETNGVPVVSYQTDEFPAFFSPSSGLPSPLRLDTPLEVATAAKAGLDLGMRNGMVVAVPNPSPVGDGARIDASIRQALEEAQEEGVAGRDVTPFVLARVKDRTGGESLESNIALVRHNAVVGAEIAIELASLDRAQAALRSATRDQASAPVPTHPPAPSLRQTGPGLAGRVAVDGRGDGHPSCPSGQSVPAPRVAIFGGAVADTVAIPHPGTGLTLGTSVPGKARRSFGGVGRNVAEGVARILSGMACEAGSGTESVGGAEVTLVSVVGPDEAGRAIVAHCEAVGVKAAETVDVGPRTEILEQGASRAGGAGPVVGGSQEGEGSMRTASYTAVLGGDGDLVAAVADMAVLDTMTQDFVDRHSSVVARANVAVCDGNLPPGGFAGLGKLCAKVGIPLVFEPTSVPKSCVPFSSKSIGNVALVSPNLDELAAMGAAAVEFMRESSGCARTDSSTGPSEGPALSDRPRAGHELAGQVVLDGELSDPRPLGPALEAVLRSMFTSRENAERSVHDAQDGSTSSRASQGPVSGGNSSLCATDPSWVNPPFLLDGAKHVLVTLGSAGVLHASARPIPTPPQRGPSSSSDTAQDRRIEVTAGSDRWLSVSARHFPALPLEAGSGDGRSIVDCTGAGDCLVAGVVGGLMLGWPVQDSILMGLVCARESIQVEGPVPESLGELLRASDGEPGGDGRRQLLQRHLPGPYASSTLDLWRS